MIFRLPQSVGVILSIGWCQFKEIEGCSFFGEAVLASSGVTESCCRCETSHQSLRCCCNCLRARCSMTQRLFSEMLSRAHTSRLGRSSTSLQLEDLGNSGWQFPQCSFQGFATQPIPYGGSAPCILRQHRAPKAQNHPQLPDQVVAIPHPLESASRGTLDAGGHRFCDEEFLPARFDRTAPRKSISRPDRGQEGLLH